MTEHIDSDHDRILHIEGKLDSLRELVDVRLKQIASSTTLASTSMDKRLEGMNEFRAQLRDQTAHFITRAEYEAIRSEVQDLKETRAMLSGKASQSSMTMTMLLAFGSLVVGIAALIISVVV